VQPEQHVRIAIRPSGIDFYAKRSYEFVVSNKNKHKKHNNDDLMLESMMVKKAPVPVMGNIHELIGKSNREKCARSS
jgi:hypothetical protein